MTTYYKATRLDGTDFYTGTIQYKVGKRVRPRRTDESPRACGPGVLHAADVPAETLIGGTWPCRLFEVTGKPILGFDDRHPHKGGFKELRVVCEVDAWRVLGPNGQEIVALIERAGRLTTDEAQRLAAARDAARAAARDAAGNAARDAARDAARAAARAAAWDAAWDAAGNAARAAAGDAAWDAAWDAARALVVKDLISQEHFNVLYGPWKQVIG